MKQFRDTPYEVDMYGNVYRMGSSKPLKPDDGNKGYKRVSLCINGKVSRYLIHRMVAEIYLSNPSNYKFINHIDHNPSNNCVSNLEWCTHSMNMVHCHKAGRCSNEIASKKASEKNFINATNKFKDLLGDNFISVIFRNAKSFVQYYCPSCHNKFETRSDSTIFKRNGICRPCNVKMKI